MKKTDNFPQFSRDESVFVKMGELFTHFDRNILILRGLGNIFCLFLMIFVSAYCMDENSLLDDDSEI